VVLFERVRKAGVDKNRIRGYTWGKTGRIRGQDMTGRGLVVGAVLLAVGLAGCSVNPVTGEREVSLFTDADEVSLGKDAAPDVEKELGGAYADEAVQRYVNTVGQRVARVSHRPGLEYHYKVVNSEVPNALALPGGYIYITRGLLKSLENEAQLAAVLGHETGHVTAKHGVNQLQRALGMQILVDAVKSSTDSERAAALAQVTTNLLALRYSRDQETQADELGMNYAWKAGYDPTGMVGLLKVLNRFQETEPVGWTEYFQTHPLTRNRVEHAEKYLGIHYPNATRNAAMRRNADGFLKATAGLRATK